MIVAGLTGSIGMGKTTVARMFAKLGAPIWDSDAAVHALYAPGGAAVEAVERAFPEVVRDGAVDRAALSARVMADAGALERLEGIVHPMVEALKAAFLERCEAEGLAYVIVDIPLLFETGGREKADKIIVVSAPAEIQRARVLARPGMSEEKFARLMARQQPDAAKRAQADFVIDTSGSLDDTFAQVRAVLEKLSEAG